MDAMLTQARSVTALAVALTLGLIAAGALPAEDRKEPEKKTAPGLEVGAKAPEFTLKNQHGKDVALRDLLKEAPVALVFHRSASW